LETCNAIYSAIDEGGNPSDPPGLAILHKDFLSLLSLIYATTTKVAIAFKPPSPAYSAAIPQIQDLIKHASSLLHCASLFSAIVHGKTITQEAHSLTKEVVDSLRVFVSGFIASETYTAQQDARQPRGNYLIHTGAIHELIDRARSDKGLSKTNGMAVSKRWATDRASLEDGFREVGDMISDTEMDGDQDEEDGWDELGLSSGGKLSASELETAKKVRSSASVQIRQVKRSRLDSLHSAFDHCALQTN
jgi:cyclin-D1-binding protein 1